MPRLQSRTDVIARNIKPAACTRAGEAREGFVKGAHPRHAPAVRSAAIASIHSKQFHGAAKCGRGVTLGMSGE
jgi:hypothetical protein